MLWCPTVNPVPLAFAWPVSTLVLPALAVVVAVALLAVVTYKTWAPKSAYRPALRVVDGGQSDLNLKPA